jgi:hypothetical protein
MKNKLYHSYDHLKELERYKQNYYMAIKLSKIKPIINLKCPESYLFYKNNFNRNMPNSSISI